MFKPYLYIILLMLLPLSQSEAEDNKILVKNECTRIGSKLGSVNIQDCLKINLNASHGRSVNNAPILIKEYPPLERRYGDGIGAVSAPDIAAARFLFPVYWLARTNELAEERAVNDGRDPDNIKASDYAIAAVTAVVVSLLEKIGFQGLLRIWKEKALSEV